MSGGVIYGHVDPRCLRDQYATEDDYLRAALAYVGATVDPSNRLKQHLKASERPGRNRHYQWLKSLTKLGLAPKQIVLAEVPVSELAQAESDLIRRYLDLGCRLTNRHDAGGYTSRATPEPIRPTVDQLLSYVQDRDFGSPARSLQDLLTRSERIKTDTSYRTQLEARRERYQEIWKAATAQRDAQRERLRRLPTVSV